MVRRRVQSERSFSSWEKGRLVGLSLNWGHGHLFIIHCCLLGLIGTVIENNGQETAMRPRCKFQEFRCSDGTCLKTEKLCNGIQDCSSGEDESWDCSKLNLNTDCGDQHKCFKCRFGGCVSRKLVCNGEIDCNGGSDEASDLCGNSGLNPAPNIIPLDGKRSVCVGSTSSGQSGKPMRPRPRPTMLPPERRPEDPLSRPRPQRPRPRPRPQDPRQPQPSPVQEPRPRPTPPERFEENPDAFGPPVPTGALGSKPCPRLEEEEGVKIKCMLSRREVNCYSQAVTNGTVATYECKDYFSVTQNAPRSSKRICRNGLWQKRNLKWNCVPECGKGGKQVAQFIINGTTSQIGKWPWHVGMYHQDPPNSGKWKYFCGATLVSSRSVVTAAHCVSGKDGRANKDLRLFFGKYYRTFNKDDNLVQERRPLEVSIHPYYDPLTFASDLAMITFLPIDITSRVQLACLPREGDVDLEPNDMGTLVGWGRFSETRYPEELQEATLPVRSHMECKKAHPSLESLVKADSFCAGYRNGTSPCDGDSGGGLVASDTSNKWALYGVVSAGVAKRGGGCDPRYYTVFSKVVKSLDYIYEHLDPMKRRRRSVTTQQPSDVEDEHAS